VGTDGKEVKNDAVVMESWKKWGGKVSGARSWVVGGGNGGKIVDCRWIFETEEQAQGFFKEGIGFLSEGGWLGVVVVVVMMMMMVVVVVVMVVVFVKVCNTQQ